MNLQKSPNLEETKSLFLSSYVLGKFVPFTIKRKDVPYTWFEEVQKQTNFSFSTFVKFMKISEGNVSNKRLLTSKQGKKIISYIFKNHVNLTDIPILLENFKLSDITIISSLTKLELLILLKNTVENSKKDKKAFSELFSFYISFFKKENEEVAISFCNLLIFLKLGVFSQLTDTEVITSFCEMHMNNCVKDLYHHNATSCYNNFQLMLTLISFEKKNIFGYDIVVKIVEKFMLKFFCETTVIKFLIKFPFETFENLCKELQEFPKICILYLQTLLNTEPNFDKKILFRLTCLDKKLNRDNDFLKTIDLAEKHVEVIDSETLKIIHQRISQVQAFIKVNYPFWDIYNLNQSDVNWNIPTLTYVSKEEMTFFLKESFCNKLHFTKQGYMEFYELDQWWLNKGIKKFKLKLLDQEYGTTLKMVSDKNIKYILPSEKLGSYWGYMCLDEYKEDCNEAKSCDLNLSLEQNEENREKISKCAVKRDIYQAGSTSKSDNLSELNHNKQISQKYSQLLDCNNIIFDKKFVYN